MEVLSFQSTIYTPASNLTDRELLHEQTIAPDDNRKSHHSSPEEVELDSLQADAEREDGVPRAGQFELASTSTAPSASSRGSITRREIRAEKTSALKLKRQEETRWNAEKDAWFAQELASSDAIYAKSPNTYTNVLIRNFAYSSHDRRGYRERRMRELAQAARSAPDLRVSVGLEQLQAFWVDMTPRWQTFFDAVSKLPLATWQQVAPTDIAQEYRWFGLAYEWIDIQVDQMDNWVYVAQEEGHDPVPHPEVIEQSTRSATLGPGLRGMDETAETRVREYIRRATVQRTTLRSSGTAEKGRHIPNGHLTTQEALSSISSYKTNVATLAAIAFFGASVAWSAVFSGTRGDVVLLAWSSTMFVCGSVAAGATAIIIGADTLDLDRDMNARRSLRGFIIASAAFILIGIILLAITMALIDPDDNSGGGDSGTSTTHSSRLAAMRASGTFTIAVSLTEIGIALWLRRALTPGRYKW